jgi:hypothetical protein
MPQIKYYFQLIIQNILTLLNAVAHTIPNYK